MSDEANEAVVDVNEFVVDSTLDSEGTLELTLSGHWGISIVLFDEESTQTLVALKQVRTEPLDDIEGGEITDGSEPPTTEPG